MDKPQIIGIGLEGLIGSRIRQLLENEINFVSLGINEGIDITDPSTLAKIKEYGQADYVLHLAARTDVDGCEKEKELAEESESWKTNVVGTKNIAQICNETGKKIIYFSTDFVFDGKKPRGESYSEEDLPNPINWYAVTKYEGELEVEKSGADYLILRTAFPYRAEFDKKKDLLRSIKERLEGGEVIDAVWDQYFCPTFIDDIAQAFKKLIEYGAFGIYHVVGSDVLSPYEVSIKITEEFGLNKGLIRKVSRKDFFKNKAARPFNLALRNDKIEKLEIRMKGFEEGLKEIKNQISKIKNSN
ncbi:MAG: dTDP-4-dehydrorhamnose reductase [Candidatus Woesebacteria bacterium GW2011_GWB1_38_5b]|uniref:dTDP-4-dehydrorhamnose reductase n=1 Tax=Candidatus Woesebacteria bacterium GW2011_GWB1_38_5b TaxID=1618569 RepID=A0A0G0MN96_9BACT|nr:MAG: dTDP-4-dehydrorhamnose reductase [Candidatus Woesebacteria bacterium GW2011_GWB1_38_5b]OGH48110.1 MAG: hypothetical protein A3A51_01305 [Candidatus Levybacteria bacterium RIFCSPLOWO2_01_FULL_39_10]